MLPYIADITWIVIQQKSILLKNIMMHGRYNESNSENSRCPRARRAVSSQIFSDQDWPEKLDKANPALFSCSHFISSMAYVLKANILKSKQIDVRECTEVEAVFWIYNYLPILSKYNLLLQQRLYSRDIIVWLTNYQFRENSNRQLFNVRYCFVYNDFSRNNTSNSYQSRKDKRLPELYSAPISILPV